MTVVGVITTIGLILALAYALKCKADHIVYRSWAALFVCMCASTAAVVNQAPHDTYVWWYGLPAVSSIVVLTYHYASCHCMEWRSATFIGIFGFNTLALLLGLEGLRLFAGVTLLAVTVWVQIILVFMLARSRPCAVIPEPELRPQRPYGHNGDNHPTQLVPGDTSLWGWDLEHIVALWRAKYRDILHKEEEPKNGTTG